MFGKMSRRSACPTSTKPVQLRYDVGATIIGHCRCEQQELTRHDATHVIVVLDRVFYQTNARLVFITVSFLTTQIKMGERFVGLHGVRHEDQAVVLYHVVSQKLGQALK